MTATAATDVEPTDTTIYYIIRSFGRSSTAGTIIFSPLHRGPYATFRPVSIDLGSTQSNRTQWREQNFFKGSGGVHTEIYYCSKLNK